MYRKLTLELFWNFGWYTQSGVPGVIVGEGWDAGLPGELLKKRRGWPGWPSCQGQKPKGEAGVPLQHRRENFQISTAVGVGRKPWTVDSWYAHPLHGQLALSLINLQIYLVTQGRKKREVTKSHLLSPGPPEVKQLTLIASRTLRVLQIPGLRFCNTFLLHPLTTWAAFPGSCDWAFSFNFPILCES